MKCRRALKRMARLVLVCLITMGVAEAREKGKIDWTPVPDAILQVDGHPVKVWNLYRPGKKLDPLLLQLGPRTLVLYVQKQQAYDLKPDQLEHKGEDLLWRESDRPAQPSPTSEWSTRDVGSAWRVQVKLDDGRKLNIEIPQMPDLRGLY